MHTTLKISEELSLPIDAATQTFAFVARKGGGKTYAAGKLTELLMDAGVQCAIIDTVGNWYGLRLAADGTQKGYDIPILGGLRGDIPLESAGGALVADLIVETGRSVVIDISQFSLSDRKRFATDLGIRLWQRKKAERDPTPMHLVIEECQLIIPQNVFKDDARMVGIYEEIIRLGRNYGIGVSMISQRPQSVNKEVLTQTECLIVLQVNGAPERKALREWIVHQGMDVNLVEQLPGLGVGVAFVWSPQWLRVLQKVHIAKKRTFDASATPKVGVKRERNDLSPLDLQAFKARMSATIEHAKANDPGELKRKISELERQVAKASRVAPQRENVPVLSDADRNRLDHATVSCDQAKLAAADLLGGLTAYREHLGELVAKVNKLSGSVHRAVPTVPAIRREIPHTPRIVISDGKLNKAERSILRVLANYPDGKSKREVGVIAGYKHTGGGFLNAVGSLRSKAFLEGSDPLMITGAGLTAYGPVDPLPTGPELYSYWIANQEFGRAEREILRVLYEAGRPLTKVEIAAETRSDRGGPYESDGGGFLNAIGRLRTYELVERVNDMLRLSEQFR